MKLNPQQEWVQPTARLTFNGRPVVLLGQSISAYGFLFSWVTAFLSLLALEITIESTTIRNRIGDLDLKLTALELQNAALLQELRARRPGLVHEEGNWPDIESSDRAPKSDQYWSRENTIGHTAALAPNGHPLVRPQQTLLETLLTHLERQVQCQCPLHHGSLTRPTRQ